jgi:TrpR-related protein YerC/YecD
MQDKSDAVWKTEAPQQLAAALAAIDNAQTMQDFLRDVLTEKEIIEIGSRLEAARMLQAGKTYIEIIEKTKLSSRTIARISDWMQNGYNGYQVVLADLETHHGHTPPARAE